MDGVQIRRARIEDLPGLVESGAGLFAEDAGTRDPTLSQQWPRVHGPGAFREAMGDPARLTLVAHDGAGVVGHLSGTLDEPSAIRPIRVATLLSMYVMPHHRGNGVGARLVAAFRSWAAEVGADRLSVTAYATNEAAIRFYRREGFTPRSLVLEGLPAGGPSA